jgi:IstB-like ATP binding protein
MSSPWTERLGNADSAAGAESKSGLVVWGVCHSRCHRGRARPAQWYRAVYRPGEILQVDRLVHHAEILALKGDSYRLRDKDLGSVPAHD